jgi:chain length determinant protein tyrosine kinase EpsG
MFNRGDKPKPNGPADDGSAHVERAGSPMELGAIDTLLTKLVERGKLTEKQVEHAIDWQRRKGGDTRAAVQQMGLVARDDMLRALSQRYSYPILDDMPDSRRFSKELVVGHEPFGAPAEAIRSIRSTIASTALASGTRSICIIGPHPDAGVTYLASNLAISFAQMGIPTLLVDANLRDPRAGTLFGISRSTTGLSDYLISKSRGQPCIQMDVLPNLALLPAGAVPPNPQELLSSPEFLALTDLFHDQFGVVLYDTAPCEVFSDALVIGARVSAAILVARKHRTGYREIATLVRKLESVRCAVVGSVFNQH